MSQINITCQTSTHERWKRVLNVINRKTGTGKNLKLKRLFIKGFCSR
jgi:hypothetical protein